MLACQTEAFHFIGRFSFSWPASNRLLPISALKSGLSEESKYSTVMFEISGNDISNLGDADLRSLVARLAVAELRTKGYPRSSVTAGGNQDAADGGVDVRVECLSDFTDPDFVPRRLTGFQVKKPDMPPSAIRDEMRPQGALREVIRELADAAGAYVIVSSQGSVADKSLAARRNAMRAALNDVPSATQLHTDFYDRDRLATWVNEYPGIAAWVRSRVGRPLSGWSGIGDWEGGGSAPKPYLSSDKNCLVDESSSERENLTITEGIARMRARLRIARQCIRLVGLSGNGKTRLVQALFEEGVGENPLDSSLAVYTDYSSETNPTARDIARELIAHRRRAILVVDNCNPATHSELARLCSSEASGVSLITVEYDVRDDEPEHTDVFRLQSISPELVVEWIKQNFPDISQVDREKIAEFSDGNFRVASVLAGTLGKGETLGRLKDSGLFERIFFQRKQPDQQLLQAAEDLSLLYSIEGDNVSGEGELARVAAIRGIGVLQLYEALAEMRKRGVVQARGRFRAILPQAIANPLAALALDRIPPAHFDRFCRTLTPRMLKSVSRRLGFLHDSVDSRGVVARWLRADGPLGDLFAMGEEGFQIISNIAPVAPEEVLAKIEKEIEGPNGQLIIADRRHQWSRLIRTIGYDTHLFDRAVVLLARCLPEESGGNNINSAHNAFSDFFHLYLSGTQATPVQRREAIKRLAASHDDGLRRSAQIALRALLKSSFFSSMGSYDFGARSRDWGWYPKMEKDIWDWFEEAIKLVLELAPDTDARVLLADNLRGLWDYPVCRDALERAAAIFSHTRPWIEGWIACRAALRFDGKDMSRGARAKLEQLIKRLKPSDLLNQARAVVLNRMPGGGGWDFADGEDDEGDAIKAWKKADRMAWDVGRALASDASVLLEFINELVVEPHPQRAFEFGRGLADGESDLSVLWLGLTTAYSSADYRKRNGTVLGGFICEAHRRDRGFASQVIEAAMHNPDLLPILPYLQSHASLDVEGIGRLRRTISNERLAVSSFYHIANNRVSGSPPQPLSSLLEDIGLLPNGIGVALYILHMRFFSRDQKEGLPEDAPLISVGRDLLARSTFGKDIRVDDYAMHTVIRICLVGEQGGEVAEKVCTCIRLAIDSYEVSSDNLTYTLKELFEVQPFVALDTFLLPMVKRHHGGLFDEVFNRNSFIENLDPVILQKWANFDPVVRYPLLGKCLRMFSTVCNEEKDISSLFVAMLAQAPDKRLFLGSWDRLHPRSWSGSLTELLMRRKAQVIKLAELSDEQVRAWIAEALPRFDQWIEHDRGLDREREESFE